MVGAAVACHPTSRAIAVGLPLFLLPGPVARPKASTITGPPQCITIGDLRAAVDADRPPPFSDIAVNDLVEVAAVRRHPALSHGIAMVRRLAAVGQMRLVLPSIQLQLQEDALQSSIGRPPGA